MQCNSHIGFGREDDSIDTHVDIDCLRQKLERICKEGTTPSYLDCENIHRCIDAGEQEIMKCAKVYLLRYTYYQYVIYIIIIQALMTCFFVAGVNMNR